MLTLTVISVLSGMVIVTLLLIYPEVKMSTKIFCWFLIFVFFMTTLYCGIHARQEIIVNNIGNKKSFIVPTYQIQVNPQTQKLDTVGITYKLINEKNKNKYVQTKWDN